MIKKVLILMLTFFLLLLHTSALSNEINLVKSLGIMQGYDNGEFGEDDLLTRAQFSKIAISLLDRYFIPIASVSPYGDVPYTHWSAPYIAYASEKGLLSGYPDGNFLPDNTVTYEEACKVLLAILGYTAPQSGDWASAQINTAKKVGILNQVTVLPKMGVNRYNAALMVKNTLLAKPKENSNYYIETLGYSYFENAVLITDKTTSQDMVLTTVGEFKKNNVISDADLLKCGGLIIDEYNNIISFVPKGQTKISYVINTVLPGGITTFESKTILEIEDDTTVFVGERQSVYQNIKTELKYGDKITLYINNLGKTEYITVEKDVIKGPATNISSSIITEFNIDITNPPRVIKDGNTIDISDLADLDICYYIKETNLVLVYSNKATGVYENAHPTKDNPTSITLSGKNYKIGDIKAFNKLSSNGSIDYGDTITILLDKDGDIADVVTTETMENLTAYLLETGQKQITNSNNETSYLHYVRLATFESGEMEYISDKNYSSYRGKMVIVSFDGGKAKLKTASYKNSVFGKFNWSNKTVGDNKIDNNIKIIDTSKYDSNRNGRHINIFPQRLDGVNLGNTNIIYSEKNQNGEISRLVLDNVTNDMYMFGLVVKANNKTGGYIVSGDYDVLIGTENRKLITNNLAFSINSGQPALFDFEGLNIERIIPLTPLEKTVASIDDNYLYTSDAKYRLSDKVLVYRKTSLYNTEFELNSLSVAKTGDYKIKAYYDNLSEIGGRIRVLLLQTP